MNLLINNIKDFFDILGYKNAKKGLEEDHKKNKIFIDQSDYLEYLNSFIIRIIRKQF